MTLFPGVALVTGAGSGIGQTTAVSFAREGCRRIAITDLNALGLTETNKLISSIDEAVEVHSKPTDISDEHQIQSFVQDTADHFGRIDYAVNVAGIMIGGAASHEEPVEVYDRTHAVNSRGCWLSSRAEIAQMLKQEPLETHDGRLGNRGSVVNIASVLGNIGRPGAVAYCSSKAAVISMTQCDAIDYSKHNIRINCVCPGIIHTPMTDPIMSALEPSIAAVPIDRAGTAQEIADAVLFLSSSKATFVQGSAMVVDGGYSIH